jgi:hypothetical protein
MTPRHRVPSWRQRESRGPKVSGAEQPGWDPRQRIPDTWWTAERSRGPRGGAARSESRLRGRAPEPRDEAPGRSHASAGNRRRLEEIGRACPEHWNLRVDPPSDAATRAPRRSRAGGLAR